METSKKRYIKSLEIKCVPVNSVDRPSTMEPTSALPPKPSRYEKKNATYLYGRIKDKLCSDKKLNKKNPKMTAAYLTVRGMDKRTYFPPFWQLATQKQPRKTFWENPPIFNSLEEGGSRVE